MEKILICKCGEILCEKCEMNKKCPYKNDLDFHLRILKEKMLKEIDVDFVIRNINKQVSLFNQISYWKNTKLLSEANIYEPLRYYFLKEKGSFPNEEVRKKIEFLLGIITQKIILFLNNQCSDEDCPQCFLLKHCPNE